jgi:hypothetical protein
MAAYSRKRNHCSQVCSTIRDRFSNVSIPVIIVSARNDPEDVMAGLSSGSVDYIKKPYHRLGSQPASACQGPPGPGPCRLLSASSDSPSSTSTSASTSRSSQRSAYKPMHTQHSLALSLCTHASQTGAAGAHPSAAAQPPGHRGRGPEPQGHRAPQVDDADVGHRAAAGERRRRRGQRERCRRAGRERAVGQTYERERLGGQRERERERESSGRAERERDQVAGADVGHRAAEGASSRRAHTHAHKRTRSRTE